MKNITHKIILVCFSIFSLTACSESKIEEQAEAQKPEQTIKDDVKKSTPKIAKSNLLITADSLLDNGQFQMAKVLYDSILNQNVDSDNKELILEKISKCQEIIKTEENPFENFETSFLGSKKFGVQFIWDGYGKAKIYKEKETIHFKGEQYSKDKSEYLKMDGVISIIDGKKFTFNGTIDLFTKDCCGEIKEKGKFVFLKSGKRKYWRLQGRGKLCDIYKCSYYLDVFE